MAIYERRSSRDVRIFMRWLKYSITLDKKVDYIKRIDKNEHEQLTIISLKKNEFSRARIVTGFEKSTNAKIYDVISFLIKTEYDIDRFPHYNFTIRAYKDDKKYDLLDHEYNVPEGIFDDIIQILESKLAIDYRKYKVTENDAFKDYERERRNYDFSLMDEFNNRNGFRNKRRKNVSYDEYEDEDY